MPDDPRWMDKKPKPEYVKHERTFAKDNGLRQTPSSGRRWFAKGDSKDKTWLVDNKGTRNKSYTLTLEVWQGLVKAATLTNRIPVMQVRFIQEESVDVVIIPADIWSVLKDGLDK